MKKKYIILTLLFIVSLLTSCKKAEETHGEKIKEQSDSKSEIKKSAIEEKTVSKVDNTINQVIEKKPEVNISPAKVEKTIKINKFGDDFETYSLGDVLGDNDFPADPWLSFGVTVMDPLRVNAKGANEGIQGASLALNWKKGKFAGIIYQFKDSPSSLSNIKFDINSRSKSETSILLQLVEEDGDIFKSTKNNDAEVGTLFKTISFDINSNNLLKDEGSGDGKIDLTKIKKVQILFLNSSGQTDEVLYIDNFRVTE